MQPSQWRARNRFMPDICAKPPIRPTLKDIDSKVFRQEWQHNETKTVLGFDVLAPTSAMAYVLGLMRLEVLHGIGTPEVTCIKNEDLPLASLDRIANVLKFETAEECEERNR